LQIALDVRPIDWLQSRPIIMTADILTHRARVSMAEPAMWNISYGQRTFAALLCGDARALDRRRAG